MNLLATLRIAAVVCAAIGLLFYYQATKVTRHDQGWAQANIDEINRLVIADGVFQRELLSSRAGLSRDYDALTRASATTEASARGLARLAGNDRSISSLTGRLVALTHQRAQLGERFKTDNALLQNSLARFTMISRDKTQSPAMSLLAAQILQLTLDTSPEAVRAARAGVARLSLETRGTAPLLAHARLLVRRLPEADRILAGVRNAPIDKSLSNVRYAVAERAAGDLSISRLLWGGVAGSWTASLVLVALMFGHLRIRARDFGRFAANEKLNAHVSNLLIDTREGELGDRMTRALRLLADRVGAEHACLCWSAATEPSFVWSRKSTHCSMGWHELLRCIAIYLPDTQETVLFRSAMDRRDDALARAMRREDIPSLLVVRTAHPLAAMLIFCGGRERLKTRPDVIAGVALALASMLQAVRHSRWERERHRLEQRLFQARRMETIGAVASGVAHNFNNILSAISGFNEIAEIHSKDSPVVSKNLVEIRSAVERASALVDDIIIFGRRSPAPKRTFALASLVEETTRLIRAGTPDSIGLIISAADANLHAFGQEARVQQVIMNICRNAVGASSDGQLVTMTLAGQSLCDLTSFSHGMLDQGDYAVITIEDSGPGIAPSVLPRIFEPFFTTRREGTGLGLSTAWEIVQEHGGTIDVVSQPGRLTRLSIWLPQAGTAPVHDSDQEVPPGNGERILLVTDPENLARDEEIVASLGYEPVGVINGTTAPSGPDALPIDAVVIANPGRRRLAALRRHTSGAPIAAAFSGPSAVRTEPFAGSLTYPFHLDELAQVLARCLRNSPGHAEGDERGRTPERPGNLGAPGGYFAPRVTRKQ